MNDFFIHTVGPLFVFLEHSSPAARPNLPMTAEVRLMKKGYKTKHCHKYVFTYKSLSYNFAGTRKQNITHVG